MRSIQTAGWVAVLGLWATSGCGVAVRSAKLSDRGVAGSGVYLSTGGSPWRYRTVGFAQVTGYGVSVGGMTDVGDAQLDSVLRGSLTQVASQMGGNGVIHIEFLDDNPQTPVERAEQLSNSVNSIASGRGGPETKNRTVHCTGEVVVFLP